MIIDFKEQADRLAASTRDAAERPEKLAVQSKTSVVRLPDAVARKTQITQQSSPSSPVKDKNVQTPGSKTLQRDLNERLKTNFSEVENEPSSTKQSPISRFLNVACKPFHLEKISLHEF